MKTLTITLSRRDLSLMLAGLMTAENAPDAFRLGLKALGQPDAEDGEVVELGERVLKQLDPEGKLCPEGKL